MGYYYDDLQLIEKVRKKKLLHRIKKTLFVEQEAPVDADAINAALTEWKDAQRYFESVKEPELIDFAIYDMEAARRKYIFLLKQAKQK